LKSRTERAYDIWAPDYDNHPNPHILLEHDDVLKLVSPKRSDKILDAGCGTGKYTLEFSKKGAEVTGTDFSDKMLEIARKKCPGVKFYRADLQKKLSFRSGWFNKINCAQTLKHIRNINFTLKEFYRVLQRGGIMVFSVTHPDMDWHGYETKSHWNFILGENSDIYHHKFKDYLFAVDNAGFKIDTIKQLPINKKIELLLTPKSYRIVKGRFEIIIFRLNKT